MKLLRKKCLAIWPLILCLIGVAQANTNINSILFIGDSHAVRDFGDSLFSHLQDINPRRAEVHSYASCGSSPHQWLNSWITNCGYKERHFIPRTNNQESPYLQRQITPLLNDLLQLHRPQLVVIEIGGNATGLTQRGLNSSVRRFLALITQSGAKCIWAGPPEAMIIDSRRSRRISPNRIGEGLNAFYARLQIAIGGRCALYDSRPITPPLESRGGDGIHFLGDMAHDWARDYFDFINGQLNNR